MRQDMDAVPGLDAGDPYPCCGGDCHHGRQPCRCDGLCRDTDPLPLTRWTLLAAIAFAVLAMVASLFAPWGFAPPL